MPDADIALFVAASLAVIIAPGPDNVYVVTRGVAQGRRVALASAWGMCSGLLFHTTFAALGLSAILARSAAASSVIKYAGAAYLVYLGARALLNMSEFVPPAVHEPRQGRRRPASPGPGTDLRAAQRSGLQHAGNSLRPPGRPAELEPSLCRRPPVAQRLRLERPRGSPRAIEPRMTLAPGANYWFRPGGPDRLLLRLLSAITRRPAR